MQHLPEDGKESNLPVRAWTPRSGESLASSSDPEKVAQESLEDDQDLATLPSLQFAWEGVSYEAEAAT
jgi:hypothetical protein